MRILRSYKPEERLSIAEKGKAANASCVMAHW
jgi:hypothetical protein